jgi:uncharacterized protein YfaS (alpha-2-macroglobulin family)
LKSLSGGKSDVKQNDRFVIALKVTSEETGGRVMLVDHLPAGFEIENPHLVESGSIASIDWLKATAQPEHTEFRDDRFVAAFNFSGSNVHSDGNAATESNGTDENGIEGDAEAAPAPSPEATPEITPAQPNAAVKTPAVQATVAYIVRAVTPGTYVHPAATVEDMYRPDRYARTAAGTLTVGSKE